MGGRLFGLNGRLTQVTQYARGGRAGCKAAVQQGPSRCGIVCAGVGDHSRGWTCEARITVAATHAEIVELYMFASAKRTLIAPPPFCRGHGQTFLAHSIAGARRGKLRAQTMAGRTGWAGLRQSKLGLGM